MTIPGGASLLFAYALQDRTISRLTEMQSLEYLISHAQRHVPQNLLALKVCDSDFFYVHASSLRSCKGYKHAHIIIVVCVHEGSL